MAPKERRSKCRHAVISKTGLSARNEELMPSDEECGGAPAGAHDWGRVYCEQRHVFNLHFLM